MMSKSSMGSFLLVVSVAAALMVAEKEAMELLGLFLCGFTAILLVECIEDLRGQPTGGSLNNAPIIQPTASTFFELFLIYFLSIERG